MKSRSWIRLTAPATLGLALAALAGACGDEDGDLAVVLTEPRPAPPDACSQGGTVFVTGADRNGDSALGDDEVEARRVVCNPVGGTDEETGPEGLDALLAAAEAPPGTPCPEGGIRIEGGLDQDRDGTLDPEEVEDTAYVCDQPAGASGARFLVESAPASAADCEQGGVVLESGLDDDRDEILDDIEVDFTRVICAGRDGPSQRVEIEPEPPGSSCTAGGQRISEGVDANRDGALQPTEIASVSFVCDPVAGLVQTSTLGAGPECAGGGLRLERGLDADGDGTLSLTEVVDVAFLCAGPDGLARVTRTSTEAPGSNCSSGGIRLETGRDADRDGILDNDEIESTSFVCDGAPGADGRANSAVRVTAEPAGTNCPAGGTRVESGPDSNGDGQLGDGEVRSTTFACNAPARSTLVRLTEELPGPACLSGGQRLEFGEDLDGDGVLDPAEVAETRFVCSTVPVVPVAITTPPSLGPVFAADDLSSVAVEGVGGLGGGYSWSLLGAPPGVGIGPSGTPSTTLTGSLTSTGTFTFDVVLSDAVGAVARRTFTLIVNSPPCQPGRGGLVGLTATEIPSAASGLTGSFGIGADSSQNGWVYIMGTSELVRIRKDGSAFTDLESQLGLGTTDLGYEVQVFGNDIYIVDDSSTTTTGRVTRISRDGGVTFQTEDIVQFGTAPSSIRGIEVEGSRMFLITLASSTEIFSVDLNQVGPMAPATGTSLGVVTGASSCSGLALDSRYFYTACDGSPTSNSVVRIDRQTLAVDVLIGSDGGFEASSSYNAVEVQDPDGDGLAEVLWVGGFGERVYLCEPATAGPVFFREFGAAQPGDYGLALDRANRVLWSFEDSGADRLVRFQ